jgi:hypothetical protein
MFGNLFSVKHFTHKIKFGIPTLRIKFFYYYSYHIKETFSLHVKHFDLFEKIINSYIYFY